MHGIVFNTGTVATRVVVVARDRFQFCLVEDRSRTNREVYKGEKVELRLIPSHSKAGC